MKKALIAAGAVAALVLGGCQQEGSWSEEENTGSTSEDAVLATANPTLTTSVSKLQPAATRAVNECARYNNTFDNHLAALGTLVLKCKKSIGPNDFVIEPDRRNPKFPAVLRPNFKCDDERVFRDIDNLLGLQLVEYSSAYPYFIKLWQAFLERHKGAGSPVCPLWEHVREENAPSKEAVASGAKGKSHDDWKLHPDTGSSCQEPRCLVETAQLCTSWLGTKFWETANADTAEVRTDPSWWKDNTNYGDPDFFDQLAWTHLMATDTGWPPGDLYGAPARWGEWCTFYASDMMTVVTGKLYNVECAPGWWCVTQCKAEATAPAPAPVPAY